MLREKHPAARATPVEVLDDYGRTPGPLVLTFTQEVMESAARRLQGAAGPCGLDATELKHLLFRFGPESKRLMDELAAWTVWLSAESPPWAAYRAMMANRLIAIDKQPGVRPVGCGEVFRRLWAKALIVECGDEATEACGRINLCAGLSAGIEGAFHALRRGYDATAADAAAAAQPQDPPAVGPDADDPPEPPPIRDAMVLVDAINGFNELNRTAMLWAVRHRWASGARFAFNCYRHHAQLVLRRRQGDSMILLSQEGVTQGDPLSMILYGIGLLPLSELLLEEFPGLRQPWYADDAAAQGDAEQLAPRARQEHPPDPPRIGCGGSSGGPRRVPPPREERRPLPRRVPRR